MIRYDRSASSVVVACSCGWREIAATQTGAWRVAEHHETHQHPDRFQVRDAARRRAYRAAHPDECHGTGPTMEP